MRKIFLIIGLLFLLGCTTGNVVREDTTHIGGAFALTGFASSWGTLEYEAVQMALDEWNREHNTNVQLVVEDTQSRQKDTVSAVQKLYAIDNVDAIIGATWLDSFNGAAPLAEQHQKIMITPSANVEAIQNPYHPHVFSFFYRANKEAEALVDYWVTQHEKDIFVIMGRDPYWEVFLDKLEKVAEDADITLTVERTNKDDKDFRTLLLKVKEHQPDGLFFGYDTEKSLVAFFQQRPLIVPEIQLYGTEVYETYFSVFPELMQGMKIVSPEIADLSFKQKFKEKTGKDAVASAPLAYDVTFILLEALQTKNPVETLKTQTFDSVTYGNVSFDDINGVEGGTFVIKQSREGEAIIIDTPK